MEKSPDAFRTISEVAEILETPAHVLRFWESRFPQVRPVKRAGGRRYYRPSDVALLAGIRALLHDQGLTIRGVQKILREQGVRHVAMIGGAEGAPGPETDIAASSALHDAPVPPERAFEGPAEPAPVGGGDPEDASAAPPGAVIHDLVTAIKATARAQGDMPARAAEMPEAEGAAAPPEATPQADPRLPSALRLRALSRPLSDAGRGRLRALHARMEGLHARLQAEASEQDA